MSADIAANDPLWGRIDAILGSDRPECVRRRLESECIREVRKGLEDQCKWTKFTNVDSYDVKDEAILSLHGKSEYRPARFNLMTCLKGG